MFDPPVQPADGGIVIGIPTDERSLLLRLLGELEQLLRAQAGDASSVDDAVTGRLNPAAYDDAEREAEYQRLMSDDLLASRLAAIETVRMALGRDRPVLDEGAANAFMRSLNTVRLVLGTMLGVTEEDDDDDDFDVVDDADDAGDDRPEHQLYAWLSWLLEWTVRSL